MLFYENTEHYIEHFLMDIYKSGYNDGRKSVPGIEVNKVIEVIGEIKGIGKKRLETIKERLDITFSRNW